MQRVRAACRSWSIDPGRALLDVAQGLEPLQILRRQLRSHVALTGMAQLPIEGTYLSPERHGALVTVSRESGPGKRLILSPGDTVGGYRVAWIGWDRVILEKDGQEFELTIGK